MIQDIAIKVSNRSLATLAGHLSGEMVGAIGMMMLSFNPKGQTTYMLAVNGGAINKNVKLITGYDLRRLYTYEQATDEGWFQIERRT